MVSNIIVSNILPWAEQSCNDFGFASYMLKYISRHPNQVPSELPEACLERIGDVWSPFAYQEPFLDMAGKQKNIQPSLANAANL